MPDFGAGLAVLDFVLIVGGGFGVWWTFRRFKAKAEADIQDNGAVTRRILDTLARRESGARGIARELVG